ncbi:GAF domain-containing protein [Pontibacter mangrovi]|uniref:GAF domain-containing protein n=1 Tax=Pontibacter mangrovi TaxID=2589816 RepID=A0A501WB75_9BACT|nr:GAF domain-containing protein [Pontibacter mangrovi]TPE45304.1 GAF domain-containing protein [Pontibacter mangrovi]
MTPEAQDPESQRLVQLHRYLGIPSIEKGGVYSHVVGMAAHIFKMPIAFLNFVAKEEVLTQASIGLPGLTKVSREKSLCCFAILRDEVTVFRNIREEPCLFMSPFAHGEFGVAFYAAAPLVSPGGLRVGALGVADTKIRDFSRLDELALQKLAAYVIQQIEAQAAATR